MSATTWKPTWEYVPDEPFCMWCGSKNVEEWSEDNPVCPKCGGVMQKLDKYDRSTHLLCSRYIK